MKWTIPSSIIQLDTQTGTDGAFSGLGRAERSVNRYMFNKCEVMMTMEPGRYVKARELLEGQGIPFTVKTESVTSRMPSHRMGRVGEDMNYSVIYRIFTEKKEADQAKFILNNGLRGV